MKKIILACLLALLFWTITNLAQAKLNEGQFILSADKGRITLQAENASVKKILATLEEKTGLKVVVYEGVPDRKVTLNTEAIPIYAIDTLLQQLFLRNTAIVYEEKLRSMALYVLPEGMDQAMVLQGKAIIRPATFPDPSRASTIKGKPIITTLKGKNNIPIRYVDGEIILRFHRGITKKEIDAILLKYGLERTGETSLSLIGYIKARIPDGRNVISVIKEMREEYKLKALEPNYLLSSLAVTDPLYYQQWYVKDTHFDEAWPLLKNQTPTPVAVIDSGVEVNHPDLRGRILKGYDFVNGDNDPADDHGHGTFVAGIIAASVNNIGIRGLYDQAQIIPIKVIDSQGIGTYEDAAKGVIYSADQGARIINLSIGGYAYSYLLQDAVDYALEKGCILVAAGGNDGIEQPIYPAAYPDVIGVAALNDTGQIWSGSNSGKHIDVTAPGAGILSTGLGEDYVYATGTSASASMVSALAAMLVSERPDLSSSIIERLIMQSAKDLGEKGRDKIYGSGEIDAKAALAQDVNPFHDVAVRSVHVEPMVFEKGKLTYIIANIKNTGTYKSEKFDVVLYEIVGVEKKEIGRQGKVDVIDKATVIFEWKPESIKTGLKFEVVAFLSIDENESNNSKMSNMLSLGESGNLYVLYATEPPVHQWIALQAYNVLPSGSLKNEMQNYIPTNTNAYWTNLLGENFGYYGRNTSLGIEAFFPPLQWRELDFLQNEPYQQSTALIEGAMEEDSIYELRWKNHFWDPDGGYDDGLFGFASAIKKAVDDRFKKAIDNYAVNKKNEAYYWLGRAAHLLMDMTVPDHVHKDPHIGTNIDGDGDSSYEIYTAKYYKNITSQNLSSIWDGSIDTLPLSVSSAYSTIPVPGGYDGSNYSQSKLVKLFYNTAQYAQFFDSDDKNGNETDALNMKTTWGVTSQNGGKRKDYSGVLNINQSNDQSYGIDSVVSVFWDKQWPRTDKYLTVGTDYTVSLSGGKIYLDYSVFYEANQWPTDSFTIVYTKDGNSNSVTKYNIDENVKDIPETVLATNQVKLQSHAIKAVAALYRIFWEKTHGSLSGVVIDKNTHNPITNAVATIYQNGSSTPLDGQSTHYTDSNGKFTFTDLEEGSYYIKATNSDYSTGTSSPVYPDFRTFEGR